MCQYVTRSDRFGVQRQLFQVIEQLKNGVMLPNLHLTFRSEEMDSTYSNIDPVEDMIGYFHDTDTKMNQISIIREYFYHFPEIAKLSCEVADLVHQNFDSKTQLSLEMRGETNSESEYLALCIRMNDYDDSVMERIRSIREEYAEDLAEMNGWFLLTTDYLPPR